MKLWFGDKFSKEYTGKCNMCTNIFIYFLILRRSFVDIIDFCNSLKIAVVL